MPKSKLPKRSIPMVRNAAGVLNTLYDEMDAFLDGNVDGKHAATVARVANSIIKALPFVAEEAD
jgi:hypothetical protein